MLFNVNIYFFSSFSNISFLRQKTGSEIKQNKTQNKTRSETDQETNNDNKQDKSRDLYWTPENDPCLVATNC